MDSGQRTVDSERGRRALLRARTARAMSLLEVVFAVVLLALIASAVSSAISFVGGSEIRAQKRLGAYELANRLLLQRLTDPHDMPSTAAPLDYDRFRYRYRLAEDRVLQDSAMGEPAAANANRRFKQIRVTVWEADESALGARIGEPLAILTRLVDPFAVRNPEAVPHADDVVREIEELFQLDFSSQGGGQ